MTASSNFQWEHNSVDTFIFKVYLPEQWDNMLALCKSLSWQNFAVAVLKISIVLVWPGCVWTQTWSAFAGVLTRSLSEYHLLEQWDFHMEVLKTGDH